MVFEASSFVPDDDHEANSEKRDVYYLASSDNQGFIPTTCQLKDNIILNGLRQ